jgi:cytochrome P450
MAEIRITGYQGVRTALLDRTLTRSFDRELFETGNILDGVLLVLHGEHHANRRRFENPLVRRSPLEYYETEVFPATIAHTLPKMIQDDGTIDLVEYGGWCSVTVACRIAGIDLEDGQIERASQLFGLVRVFSQGVTILDALDAGPEEIKARVRAALEEFDRDFFAASKARRSQLLVQHSQGEIEEEDLPRDLLTNLLRHQDSLGMDDDAILHETAFFVGAGSHTNSQNVPNAMQFLLEWSADHPEDAERLQTDRQFVQKCVHEAIRLRPTTPLIRRKALRSGEIAGQVVNEGDYVIMDIFSANIDRSAYGELADVFDPHRDIPADVPGYGVSFGGGMHQCIGKTVAAGELPGHRADPDNHLYGLVTLMVEALLHHGIQPHPSRRPVPNTRSARWAQWLEYPVVMASLDHRTVSEQLS